MCEMCDGKTLGEIHLEMHLRIADRGWDLVAVEGGGARVGPWAYTVGLCAGFGHPELAVTDVELRTAAAVLGVLADAVVDGSASCIPGETVRFGKGRSVRFASVHPTHLGSDLLNGWHRYYADLGPPAPDLRLLQVVFGEEWFCSCHRRHQRDLARPVATARTGASRRSRRRRR